MLESTVGSGVLSSTLAPLERFGDAERGGTRLLPTFVGCGGDSPSCTPEASGVGGALAVAVEGRDEGFAWRFSRAC